jgi:cell division protein FtsW
MAKKLHPDKWLFAATVGLALFGVVMVYSASAMIAQEENHSQFYYLVKQGIWTAIGLVVMFVLMQVDYRYLRNRRVVYGLILLTVVMLFAVFGFGKVNGAHRWIRFGGFSIQPSEISKLSLAIFLAYFLEKRAGGKRIFGERLFPA